MYLNILMKETGALFSPYLGKLVRAEALSAGSASPTQARRDIYFLIDSYYLFLESVIK